MAISIRSFAALLILVLVLSPARAVRREPQPIVLDAQSFDLDYKNGIILYHKVRIAQGAMSVVADQAQTVSTSGTPGLNFENSRWTFRGTVKISLEQGQLSSDDAQITFSKNQLVNAIANGKPAQFEQRIEKSGKLAQGHADSIDYDVPKGLVVLSRDAWLSDGQNEIHGESLKYNVVSQNIVAEGAEQGSQRVHIIITPPPNPKP